MTTRRTSAVASRCGQTGLGRAAWSSNSSPARVKCVGRTSGAWAGSTLLTARIPKRSVDASHRCHSTRSIAASHGWTSTSALLGRRGGQQPADDTHRRAHQVLLDAAALGTDGSSPRAENTRLEHNRREPRRLCPDVDIGVRHTARVVAASPTLSPTGPLEAPQAARTGRGRRRAAPERAHQSGPCTQSHTAGAARHQEVNDASVPGAAVRGTTQRRPPQQPDYRNVRARRGAVRGGVRGTARRFASCQGRASADRALRRGAPAPMSETVLRWTFR